MSDPIGRTLGVYQIEAELGHGGMSDVYRGVQPSIGREVAIKVLPAHLLQDRSFLERFNREVQVIAKLKHPRIVPVIDYGQQDGSPYIVMAYMEGGTLADVIKQSPGGLPLDRVTRLVSQIAEGLDYAHKRGVVHRDFKPSNVLLDTEGNAHLADFGIARLTDDPSHLTGSGLIGTPAYMAPEMSRAGAASPLADLYSMGVTLYEMLTGQRPYQGDTPVSMMMAHATAPVPDATAIRPDLPAGLQTVLNRALAKNPQARYATAAALAADLARAAGGQTVDEGETQVIIQTPRPTQTPPMTGRRGIPMWAWAAGVITVLVLIFAVSQVIGGAGISGAPGGTAALDTSTVEAATPAATLAPTPNRIPTLTEGGRLTEHRQQVWRLVYSPDGKTLVSTSSDHTAVLWDVPRSQVLRVLEGHTGEVTSAAFSPAEPLIATGSKDDTIIVWDTRTGQQVMRLQGQHGTIFGVGFSADGATLVSLEFENGAQLSTTTLWDAHTGQRLKELTGDQGCLGCTPTGSNLAVSPAEPLVAVGTLDQGTLVWDLRSDTLVHKYSLAIIPESFSGGGVDDTVFSSDGALLASSGHNGLVGIWNTRSAAVVWTKAPASGSTITDISFSPDGRWLAATAPYNKAFYFLDATTGEILLKQDSGDEGIFSLTFSPDGKLLITGDAAGKITVWDIGLAP